MLSRNALQLALLAGACAAIPSARVLAQTAETGVAPDAGINTADGGSSSNSPFNTGAGTCQIILDRSVLDQIPVGCVITSIAFRLDASAGAAWPGAATSFSDYEIRLGKAANFASGLSATFANNVVPGTDVKVRDGLLAPLPGAFSASAAAPNAESFGPAITFTTPFYYTGGGLAITLRHSGQVGGTSPVLDAHAAPGVGFVFANGQLALNGIGINSAPVVRIGFVRDTAHASDGVNKMFIGEELATADGETGTYTTVFDKNPRTIATIFAPGELDSFGPGTSLTGMSLRNDESATVPENSPWPTVAKNFGSWYLQLSHSTVPVGGMLSDIASNVGADAVDVYDGPLQIPALALLPDVNGGILGTPAPFSFVVPFQHPYEYRGGPLFMLNRHSGHGQVEDLRTDRQWASLSQSAWSGSEGAVVLVSQMTPPIYRFSADAAVIAPNDRALTDGNSLTSQILTATDATYQVLIHEDELRHIPVGSVINSFALRRAAGAGSAWPDSDLATLDYDIWLSTAARTPGTMSTTFATNEGADKLQVRDGPMGVKANSYPSGAGAQPYGPAIEFQRGFAYTGGGLCITVRTKGLPGASLPNFTGDLNSSAVRTVTTADSAAVAGAFSAGPAIKLGYIASGVTSGSETTGRRIFDSNRTNQMIYSAASLNDIPPGAKITGMSFRNRVTQTAASYPASNTLLPRFDVALSTAANTPSTMSTTVASNEGADRIDARTGPLTLPAGAFKDSPILPTNDADEFDFYIDFPQAFLYRGSDLCVTIRSESPLNPLSGFDVAAMNSSPLATMRKDDSNADAAVLGPFAAPPIIRFAYTPPSRCLADLNKDGVVNDDDFQIFVIAYDTLDCNTLDMPAGCPADFNFDGLVDDLDFQVFVMAYNELLCL
ncbi:MAG: hypothetical protein JSS51_08685 [Planctomycetes bacterium]|nr:hypothetical protein [Planctomycetota bacterium]